MTGEKWRRAVLDHLVALVAGSGLAEELVLRGSMVMPAWVGEQAREPADLDWIVPPASMVPVDREDPHPYVAELAVVQQWPEAADGAGRYEMWQFEEFGTGGLRALVPPEGLQWVPEAEPEDCPPYQGLLDLAAEHPEAAPGVVLDVKAARPDGSWTYTAYDTPGVRLVIPWTVAGQPGGEVQLDFALDERLPEHPVPTAVPRGDGGRPSVLRTPSRELSLAWKLLWLHADCAAEGRARAKDLYDAVLLAETDGIRLAPGLLRRVFAREPGNPAAADALRVDAVALWSVDWEEFRARNPRVEGTAEEWLARLGRALERATVTPGGA